MDRRASARAGGASDGSDTGGRAAGERGKRRAAASPARGSPAPKRAAVSMPQREGGAASGFTQVTRGSPGRAVPDAAAAAAGMMGMRGMAPQDMMMRPGMLPMPYTGVPMLAAPIPHPVQPKSVERKHSCNCKNSRCLKLYCECFASGNHCGPDCNCVGCKNNTQHAKARQAAVEGVLERNPDAFRPKIEKSAMAAQNARHSRGCHCRKTQCLKKYCECFQAGVYCSEHCKCSGCKNTPGNIDREAAVRNSSSSSSSATAAAAAAAAAGSPAMRGMQPPPMWPQPGAFGLAGAGTPGAAAPMGAFAMAPGGMSLTPSQAPLPSAAAAVVAAAAGGLVKEEAAGEKPPVSLEVFRDVLTNKFVDQTIHAMLCMGNEADRVYTEEQRAADAAEDDEVSAATSPHTPANKPPHNGFERMSPGEEELHCAEENLLRLSPGVPAPGDLVRASTVPASARATAIEAALLAEAKCWTSVAIDRINRKVDAFRNAGRL